MPDAAGIQLLEMKSTGNLLSPARLSITPPFTSPSTSLTAQEHRDSVSLSLLKMRAVTKGKEDVWLDKNKIVDSQGL